MKARAEVILRISFDASAGSCSSVTANLPLPSTIINGFSYITGVDGAFVDGDVGIAGDDIAGVDDAGAEVTEFEVEELVVADLEGLDLRPQLIKIRIKSSGYKTFFIDRNLQISSEFHAR